ncbi:MAG: 2Fe-2S iron-sulfur cluster-binding protein [Bacteroidota bacterium]
MIKLKIDHIPVEVKEGVTVMEAAASLGIVIPSMCFHPGFTNHPSCMVCMVSDRDRLLPSCAMPVSEGMEILTSTGEVLEARREALELLLSDHIGDCEAPCRLSCPAFMDIPLMNRLIAAGDFTRALHIVREEIALPLVLGFICPAPCEKACKRRAMDAAVSVCLLKRSAVLHEDPLKSTFPEPVTKTGKKIAIIGTGPAGLSAAFYLLRSGHDCVLFDGNEEAGGTLRHQIPGEMLPKDMLDAEISFIRGLGADFKMKTAVTREFFQQEILTGFDAVILATGHQESTPGDLFGILPGEQGTFINKKNFTTSQAGVFACGNVIREQRMAVQSVAQGKMAAQEVEKYLGTNLIKVSRAEKTGTGDIPPWSELRHRSSVSSIGLLTEAEWPEYLQEGIPGNRIDPAGGHLGGFSREEAMTEARRCMHCDCRKPASCKLRSFADEYGAQRKRFAGPDRKRLTRSMQHETVVFEPEKCIRCGLCVEITMKTGEVTGLTFAGRGFDVKIAVPFSETIREALATAARECVEACPTGAIAYKTGEERDK